MKKPRLLNDHPFIFWTITTSAGFLGLITIVSIFAISVYAYYEFGQWIAPGIKIGSVNVSGMTASEAARYLNHTWEQKNSIQASNGIQNVVLHPADVGIKINSEATSQRAFQVGRNGTTTYRLFEMTVGLFSNRQIEPIYSLDPTKAAAGIEALAPALSQAPENASIRAEEGVLITVPAETGYTVNLDETIGYLQSNMMQVLETGKLPVVMKPVPPEITDASPFLPEAEQILNSAAEIKFYDPFTDKQIITQIPPAELASWLQLSLIDQNPSITLNETSIQSYLRNLSTEFSEGCYAQADLAAPIVAKALMNGDPPTIILKHPTTRYRVQPGDTLMKIGWKLGIPYWKILDSNPGLDSNRLSAGTEIIIPSKSDLLPLPVIPNKRILISLRQQRLTVLQDGKQLKQFVISTGIDRSPTQPGVFQVQSHIKNAYASVWDLYMPDFLGIYEAWPGFMNGIHGLPMLSGGRRMWANSLGRPASYGCIILGLNEANWLYQWAEDGVIVEIDE